MEPNKDHNSNLNNLESNNSENLSPDNEIAKDIIPAPDTQRENDENDAPFASEDKYLALEQPGVSFTQEADPLANNPDHLEYRQHGQESAVWDSNNRNSLNSEAFNQDEYVLRDNIDLDEDQSTSISSNDDFDAETNTSDGL